MRWRIAHDQRQERALIVHVLSNGDDTSTLAIGAVERALIIHVLSCFIDSRSQHMRHASRRGGCHAPAAMCPNGSPDRGRQRPRRGQAEHRSTLKRWRNSLTRAKRRRWRPRVHGEREDGVSKLRQLEGTSSRKDDNDETARGDRRCTVKDGSSSLARAKRRQWRTHADSERKDRVSCLRKVDINWDEAAHARKHVARLRGSEGDGRCRRGHITFECARGREMRMGCTKPEAALRFVELGEEATAVQGEERGRFDDSEEEEEEDTRVSPQRLGDRGTLRIPGAERGATVVEQSSTSSGRRGLGRRTRQLASFPAGREGNNSLHKREGEVLRGRRRELKRSRRQKPHSSQGVKGRELRGMSARRAKSARFVINPSQVIDIGEREAAYNQRSLDPVQIRDIIDAMTTAYSQAEKTYALPTLKFAPLGLVKPMPGVRADRLKPEDWKDELARQYYYYAVAGQHNAAAARALLGTDVAVRYSFERWPARMVYFSDEDFEGYFLVSAEDNKKDLKAPPRQPKLSMRNIRWCWKELGYPKAVMGNPSDKQAQVEAWRRFCAEALHRTSYSHLWTLADDKTEQGIKKQNAALRSYFPLAMAGKSAWETGMEFFERWETGRLLAPEGAKWIAKKKKVQGLKPGSSALAKQGKMGMQEAVQLVKCDRILVRLWNYYQFKHENRPDSDWTTKYPFLKKREAILAKFEGQGLDEALWDGSKKLVSDSSLFKDCPPYMGCEDDKSIKATEKLVQNKKLPIDWKNKVLSVLTGSRSKSMEVALWNDSKDVTTIAPFGVDPLDAQMKVVELERVVGITKCHTVGHNLYSLDDRMYILFKGDDLRENTSVVYDARLAGGDAAAVGAHKKVTPTEISEMPFDACEWPVVIHGRDPVVYKGHERNPTQFTHLLEFLCKKGEGIMFLGKAHAQVVWEVLKGGRNVIALQGNSEWLQFTLDFLKTTVNSGAYQCELITKSEKPRRIWDPSMDMWFKLSARKRSRIYEFLFLEKRPARGTDIEYMRRTEHMLALLDNYHGATRLNAKNFLDRLELLYFVESQPVLRLESYGSLIDADDESLTGVVFDTGAPEVDSDTEEIDIDYRLAPVLPSPASSSASPSTNRPAQATPVRRTPSKLLARLTPRPAAPPPLRPGCQVPLQHPSRKDESIHFEGHDHRRSTEADWGHDMIWHPGTIQPAIQKGEWVMAIVDTDGEWKPSERLAKSDYLDIARSVVVDKVTSENSNLQPADPSIIATADRLFRELHDKQWLELSDDFYDLDTSPSKKKMNWKVPQSTGTQGSVGGGPPSPPTARGGGGNGHEEGGGGGSGHTTSGGSAPASSPGLGGQGRIAHSGVGEEGVNVTHSPTAGSGKSGKFARIRTSQTEDPVPVEAAKSDGIRTSTTLEQSALPSWTAFGSSGELGQGSCAGDPVSAVKGKSAGIPTSADDVQATEMGASLAVREATPPALR
ncbi:hypothetical protein CBR_g40958 [Chara braunii]|uniref:Uncharacterized protein n=1 Tax=Chara braunii TaxID=69332 RepID=A0A388LUQ6_CHABU|nr:hypothetical protein CBR_g40958 [Chara braunii]|eukprot:GBG86057.1 hypothetical protein CBR_g40958 [Chara braunii]